MEQLPNYGDTRTLAYCAFCGGQTATRDHCPSRVFLDAPYPENLPVVGACLDCNVGFSEDEEYLACLVSCVIAGSTDSHKIPREKIRAILSQKPALRARLEQARTVSGERRTFGPEYDRVVAVVTKLAQGHVLYELHELVARPPDAVECKPFVTMSVAERNDFENPDVAEVWPEVGSRAMRRMVVAGADVSPGGWLVVQPGRYRYQAFVGGGLEARIVLHEYLACSVQWQH